MFKQLIKELKFPIILCLIVLFIMRPTLVFGASMQPTLREHDILLTEKITVLKKSFDYGDIVTFHSGIKANAISDKTFVKRIIGLEGDTIRICDGQVYRNGILLEESYIGTNFTYYDDEYVVPKGKLFVLGDHRENSKDSRDPSVGFVDMDKVSGVAYCRVFPFNSFGLI